MMKKILLVCSAGMSTSLMVMKMKAAAEAGGIEVEVSASAESELEQNIPGTDILLLGPQVRYLLPKLRGLVAEDVPIAVINSVDYGTMNGKKVLSEALAQI